MPSTEVFQQKREVVAGSIQAIADGSKTDLHQDVSVKVDKDGLMAEASIWNVAHDTWKSVSKGDPFRVSLGYRSGPYKRCILGVIQEKRAPERDGSDIKYTFKGRDKSGAALRGTYKSHTWVTPTLTQVARDIAAFAGLSPGRISIGAGSFEERWPISKEHNLNHWLGELATEANDRTGTQHEFHAAAGKLHFGPKEQAAQQAITLEDGRDGNVISIDEAEGKNKKSGGGADLDFEALLDPRVSKGGLAAVTTQDYNGTYRITEYELQSSTDTGEHILTGKLASTGSKYRAIDNAPPHVPPQTPAGEPTAF